MSIKVWFHHLPDSTEDYPEQEVNLNERIAECLAELDSTEIQSVVVTTIAWERSNDNYYASGFMITINFVGRETVATEIEDDELRYG